MVLSYSRSKTQLTQIPNHEIIPQGAVANGRAKFESQKISPEKPLRFLTLRNIYCKIADGIFTEFTYELDVTTDMIKTD